MKVDFDLFRYAIPVPSPIERLTSSVTSETDRLTDVILCPPDHLAPVACCAVTRDAIDQGFSTCTEQALRQHAALIMTLEQVGVRCHLLAPSPDLPDMCFTRDIGVSTPWGLVVLNPAMPHRVREVDALLSKSKEWDLPVRRISRGTIEGGDICVAREGLLILGVSGERSSIQGADEFAEPFRANGWDVLICPFHADHLHLDTIFCMVDKSQAIACVDLLDPGFLRDLERHGISILPMPSACASTLGCNILAVGGRHILSSDDMVAGSLRRAGYTVDALDVSQFSACGGGIHCLTQPLRRVAV